MVHDPVDHGREQALVVDDRDDREEYDEQCGKRQRLFEGVADTMLFRDAVERRGEHDDEQADDARLREMQAQGEDQHDRHDRLHDDRHALGVRALLRHLRIVLLENLANLGAERRAVAEQLELFEQRAGNQADHQYRHRDVRHPHEEFDELPVHYLRDEQVLRLADQRRHAAERRAHGAVHHEAAKERAELVKVLAVQLDDLVVGRRVVHVIEVLAGGHLVVDPVEAHRDGDDDRRYRKGVEKRRKKRRREGEHQRQQHLRLHAQQDLGEREQQELAQEVDARHHEHQQHDDREIDFGLVEHHLRCRKPQHDGLHREQAPRL